MVLLKGLLFFSYLIVLTASATVKVPAAASWPNFASKSAYARALGPPMSGMDTISVPYMPNLSKSELNDGTGPYKRGIYGPFGSKPFGPMSSKFGPMSQFSSVNTIPDYSMKDEYSRKRRSIDDSSIIKLRSIMDTKPETKNLGPPPPYPTLAPISEEPEEDVNVLLKKLSDPTAPKQYLPGMFGPLGPFGPYGPAGPMMDPSMFMTKKSAFLDTLFKNLATTTPSPTSTDAPTTKSTIVPPNFWLPSSVIPDPSEYTNKVGDFLDKLFDTLKLNKTMAVSDDDSMNAKNDLVRSVKPDGDNAQAKIARSVDDLSSINAAKDTIVDSILSELGDLKSNMVTTMNDLVSYQQSVSMPPKKPFKPFAPGMWPKPTAGGMIPFQQKMAVLSQVFDMLTDLQKNITLAIENVIKAKMGSTSTSEGAFNVNYPMANDIFSTTNGIPINTSLADAIKYKLDMLDYGMPFSYDPSFGKFGPKIARTVPKTPASFWVSYPEDTVNIKRAVDSGSESLMNGENFDQKQEARSVKMQMHQGYQSLPAGSVESIQAGGGSMPGHQGGGIKLLDTSNYEDIDKWINWMEYLKNDYQGHRHHNHH
ncbi:hypothetical protein WH47_02744 [Habropoda laboriosa]|uniref:Uncharacterized protein n=1 Tax=Habropoda laboriosa TaxID=597456 RepID=A0A0L7QXA0_9HYME|nr:hypothetical protein WH47_02744 [Habropoda laboriosa]